MLPSLDNPISRFLALIANGSLQMMYPSNADFPADVTKTTYGTVVRVLEKLL